jgi:hypothetical protein
MPGAGKTTLAHTLAGAGAAVLGEYTTAGGEELAVAAHPAVSDDTAHQANWLHKAALASHALRRGLVPVYADRDWLSSLAYAFTLDEPGGQDLFTRRAEWALISLIRGALLLPAHYLVFHVDAATSLRRRTERLQPDHPWSNPALLRRLESFYNDPVHALADTCPGLGDLLSLAAWHHIDGTAGPQQPLRLLQALGHRP